MKISQLIEQLEQLKQEKGDIAVYVSNDTVGGGYDVDEPWLRISEGGSECYPYPGVYLN